jgi:hypothetical protein
MSDGGYGKGQECAGWGNSSRCQKRRNVLLGVGAGRERASERARERERGSEGFTAGAAATGRRRASVDGARAGAGGGGRVPDDGGGEPGGAAGAAARRGGRALLWLVCGGAAQRVEGGYYCACGAVLRLVKRSYYGWTVATSASGGLALLQRVEGWFYGWW